MHFFSRPLLRHSTCFAFCFSLWLACDLGNGLVQAQSDQVAKRFEIAFDYLLYLPKEYAAEGKAWPLVLFLHGSGESGSELDKVKVHGPPKHVAAGEEYPFVLVSPQAPSSRKGWEPSTLNALIDNIVATHNIDKNRIYVTGLSMGGYGAWKLAQAFPNKFAAIMPTCGGGDPDNVEPIKNLPIWIFHGAKDKGVPVTLSEKMVDALKAVHAPTVKFTLYPEAGHDSWTETYSNPEVWKWLLEQSKK